MARARNIKPGFFINEDLARCEPLARLLFAGLWCWADRDGRLEERVARLKAQILPYDDTNVDTLLAQLARERFIVRYVAGDCKCLQIINFHKHQNPHIKEPASTIPAPDKNCSGRADSLILDSLLPHPSSCGLSATTSNESETAENPTADPDGKQANGKANGATPPRSGPPEEGYPDEFENFWNAYPNRGGRKRGKHETFAQWKLVKSTDRQVLMRAVTNYAASREATEGFARDPERFLKKHWWKEWVQKAVADPQVTVATKDEPTPRQRTQAELDREYAHRK